MYAVIETEGKQYRVAEGETIDVECFFETGREIVLDRVLLIAGEGKTVVGKPVVSGAKVLAQVQEHGKGEKVSIFKYKRRKKYRRHAGFRQRFSRLMIKKIETGGKDGA